jgi:hypothetical protein
MLKLVAKLPNVHIFNVALDKPGRSDAHLDAWDRFLNRFERTLLEYENREIPTRTQLAAAANRRLSKEDAESIKSRLLAYAPRGLIVADQGREGEIRAAIRRMHRFNHIPSQKGAWDDGHRTRNIPVERIIEDPVFRESSKSHFIQLADIVAFALLKREVPPTPNIAKYGIDKMFDATLSGVCFKSASPADPLGIVRK